MFFRGWGSIATLTTGLAWLALYVCLGGKQHDSRSRVKIFDFGDAVDETLSTRRRTKKHDCFSSGTVGCGQRRKV